MAQQGSPAPSGRMRRMLSSIHKISLHACMKGEVTTGVPAEAIVSPTSTTAHGPKKTSEIAH